MTRTHGEQVADTENLRELHGALLSTQRVEQFLHEMAVMAARLAGGLSCGMTMQPSGRPVTGACSDQVAARGDEGPYEIDDRPGRPGLHGVPVVPAPAADRGRQAGRRPQPVFAPGLGLRYRRGASGGEFRGE